MYFTSFRPSVKGKLASLFSVELSNCLIFTRDILTVCFSKSEEYMNLLLVNHKLIVYQQRNSHGSLLYRRYYIMSVSIPVLRNVNNFVNVFIARKLLSMTFLYCLIFMLFSRLKIGETRHLVKPKKINNRMECVCNF